MNRVFVGNLDFGTTEESIRSLFEPYGTVDRVQIILDRDTGRSRGYAFVEMPEPNEAEEAVSALNGTTLAERELNISEARPRVTRGGSGFGFSASRL